MTTTYQWVISQMDTKPQYENLQDVVVTVHWRRNAVAVDGNNNYYANTYGAMGCETPSEIDYTAYVDLTFEQVCGWLDSGLDVSSLNAGLDAQIDNQINPPIIILPNPWDTPAFQEEIVAGDQPIV